MSIEKIDSKAIRRCFVYAVKSLNAKKEYINELNVFPVPDGDTGTNMTMTLMSAAKEVGALPENASMRTLCKAISMGSLRGARGNSGVILSQLLRGFTKVASEHEELTLPILSAAFSKAVETAYKAVMKPKEGTILTVAKGIAEKAHELSRQSNISHAAFFEEILHHGEYVLSTTPDLLPVLKEAGVVDSGGQGLVETFRGIYKAVSMGADAAPSKAQEAGVLSGAGRKEKETASGTGKESPGYEKTPKDSVKREALENADIKFGYCTEFILMLDSPLSDEAEEGFKQFLLNIGDSVVFVATDEMVKIHVHTNHPGTVFEEGLKHGSLTNTKVDNMREEHNERLFKMGETGEYEEKAVSSEAVPVNIKEPEPGEKPSLDTVNAAPQNEAPQKEAPYGFITIAVGEGFQEVFKELGTDVVIEGGQTMNPSTEEILNAIGTVNAKTIFILPNNKNIILAANQAAHLSGDKNVVVIPSRTVPQGINALINFIPDNSPEDNERDMKAALSQIKTGEVTYATRDTEVDSHTIHAGDIMGIGDHSILSVEKKLDDAVKKMLEEMVEEDSELITLYYGKDVREVDALALSEELKEAFPYLEVDIHEGGQPIYYYIVSVE